MIHCAEDVLLAPMEEGLSTSIGMDWVEAIAVGFGLACVGLTVSRSIWCWPTGLVQVAIYVFVFYRARLYSDLVLHVFYVGLQLYGWRRWVTGRANAGGELPVSKLSRRALLGACASSLIGAAVWGELMARFTNAAAPHADAFIAATSLVAQYLLARKRLENWYFWIAVDLVAIGVYWSRDLRLTAGLYGVFLALCGTGLLVWRRSLAREARAHSLVVA